MTILPTTGELIISDSGNNRLRKVRPDGIIVTIAGTGVSSLSGDNGPAINATIRNPLGIVASSTGDIFIADYLNDRVRKIDTRGIITTIAIMPSNSEIYDLAINNVGDLLVADHSNHCIRKIAKTTNSITTFVGMCGYSGYSGDNISALTAKLSNPISVVNNNGE